MNKEQIIKEHFTKMGKKSAASRLSGKSKEEVSKLMQDIRKGKKIGSYVEMQNPYAKANNEQED